MLLAMSMYTHSAANNITCTPPPPPPPPPVPRSFIIQYAIACKSNAATTAMGQWQHCMEAYSLSGELVVVVVAMCMTVAARAVVVVMVVVMAIVVAVAARLGASS